MRTLRLKMEVKVLEYFGYKGARNYTFFSGPYESVAGIKGRKRVNLIKLFKRIKLRKRNPDDKYLKPDKNIILIYLMGNWVIQILRYDWEDHIGLIFRFRNFWSNEVKVSKHKRVCYKRIFYATKLWERTDDRKMLNPTRTITEIVSGERLKEKGCL